MNPLVGDRVALRHGAGGRAMRALVEAVFVEGFAVAVDGVGLAAMDDGAALRIGDGFLVFTTDSHVVQPRFFPGGDLGRLAICGTVNDLAMMGATEPLALSCAAILEAGFPIEELIRLRDSMRLACDEAGARVVTGDTKVMGKGEVDGCVLNTSGVAIASRVVRDCDLRPGDRILLTGTIADHGLTVLAVRNRLELEGELRSDVAPINGLVRALLREGGEDVVALKDPTRGGVSSTLHELAAKSGVGIVLEEGALPIRPEVRAVAELLGIDPLQVANEGKAIVGVRARSAERVLAAARAHPLGRDAALVGTCLDEWKGRVVLDTGFGRRLVTEIEGDPMPRIC
jgi:hydrogenase expression/formation protein HypE